MVGGQHGDQYKTVTVDSDGHGLQLHQRVSTWMSNESLAMAPSCECFPLNDKYGDATPTCDEGESMTNTAPRFSTKYLR